MLQWPSGGLSSVPGFYVHPDNTGRLLTTPYMASDTVICGTCRLPLSGRDQFMGHQVISHELGIDDAEIAWSELRKAGVAYWRD